MINLLGCILQDIEVVLILHWSLAMGDLVMIQLVHRCKVRVAIHCRTEQKLLHLPSVMLLDQKDFFNLGD